jgi:PAS domain S-box-containing protein
VAEDNLFWSVFKRSRVPMFVLDNAAFYVDANDAACRAVGLTRDDFVNRRLGFGTDPERQPEVERMWQSFLRSGRLVVPYEYDSPDQGRTRLNIVCTANTPEPDRHLAMYWKHPSTVSSGKELSPRQREITQLLALGLSGEQIAGRLFLSPETVRTHIRNAMEGLQAHTRAELVARAMERGLISLQASA